MKTRRRNFWPIRAMVAVLGAPAVLLAAPVFTVSGAKAAQAAPEARPWMNKALDPDRRADLLLEQMTLEEQTGLLHGHFPLLAFWPDRPADVQDSSGYVPGVPRLGIPALAEIDASLGVSNYGRKNDKATPLPSGPAIASTWDPKLAFAGGAMIGKQARQKGFNVMLAGGVNIERDPRNGRSFEYLGEDPLLAGTMAGHAIKGVQSNNIVSTIKHFVLNSQETGRYVLNAKIDEAALRESDLLAFQIATEIGQPGAVMCAYNRVNDIFACENPFLLTQVLRKDWNYRGWVMSDWGAVHGVHAAKAGLDQESGAELDTQVFFDAPLRAAVASGDIPAERVRQMAHRILRSMFANGLFEHPIARTEVDTASDEKVSAQVAEAGIVLLKNDGILPLVANAKHILVVGGHADKGVLSGGGSSQVIPQGAIVLPAPKDAPTFTRNVVLHPSAPLAALQKRAAGATVTFNDGTEPAAAAAAAQDADIVLVFANQWSSEARDNSLSLPDDQDELISALARANAKTVVILQTASAVLMPWRDQVAGVVEAWYSGARGGEAIAKVLFGDVDAQGRLPMSFPARVDQLPRPVIDGSDQKIQEGLPKDTKTKPFTVTYTEGSDVGYRGYAKSGESPLYPFGYGLSYAAFNYSAVKVTGGETITVTFTVKNTGARAGVDTPQVYLVAGPNRRQQRLIGWTKVSLKQGESRQVSITAPRRLLADWETTSGAWRLEAGRYEIMVGPNAATASQTGSATLRGAVLKP